MLLWEEEPPVVDHGVDLEAYADNVLKSLIRRFSVGYRPVLEWRPLRVTAGTADHRKGVITLSSVLMTDPDRLSATLIHEYAHLLAVARHGAKAVGHGPEWKRAMRDLGQDPKRTHDYPVERNSCKQVIAYRCSRCGELLIRKRRLPKRRKYVHVGCGGSIKFEASRQI